MDKAACRKDTLQKRDSLTPEEIKNSGNRIYEKVTKTESYKAALNVLIYASMGSEVPTDGIIKQTLLDGKKVFCPKVTDKKAGEMKFVRINSFEDLHEGYYGIREPEISADSLIYDDSFDDRGTLAIVPGVAFDKEGHRIGYNGGFYDRFLSAHENICTMAICYRLQLYESIPFEKHDVLMDYIITD